MTKLLSNEELLIEAREWITLCDTEGYSTDPNSNIDELSQELVDLINSQKHLYAKSIVGEDFIDCDCKDADLICDHEIQNVLRAEQRARIK